MYPQQNNGLIEFTNNKPNSSNQLKSISIDDKPLINLPDILRENLDMIIVGITPSGMLGVSNHHFSGPGNHFWRCIAEVGLVTHPVSCEDDAKMLDYGIGFISFCTRPNKGTTELSRKEMKAGAALMVEKVRNYKPKIVVFNGIGIYEAFIGNKNFSMGLQPNKMENTNSVIFVMPSSSARCAQLPRAEDKIPFFVSLKKLRDHMRGDLPQLEEKDVVFENYTEFRVTQPDPRSLLKAERRRKRKAEQTAETVSLEPGSIESPSNYDDIRHQSTPLSVDNEQQKDDQPPPTVPVSSSGTPINSHPVSSTTMVTTTPLLSWPQTAGLTIIHTGGQPIIMPGTTNQSATATNTLLLLDPSGLSFSSIPVPINPPQHLQMRPVILPVSTTADAASAAPKPTTDTASTGAAQNTLKVRPVVTTEAPKSLPMKVSHTKVTCINTEIAKPMPTNSTNTQNSNHIAAQSQVERNRKSPKPVEISTAQSSSSRLSKTIYSVAVVMDDNDHNLNQSDIGQSTREKTDTVFSFGQYSSNNDPIDQWELFMNGIFTGDSCYPAPPQPVPVTCVDAVAECERFSETQMASHTLTAL